MHLRPLVTGAIVVALLLTATLGIAWAVGAEYEDAPEEDHEVLDETQSADIGNWTRVDAPHFAISFYENETIVNSEGVTLSEGSDYDFNSSDGTVYYYNTTDVSDGENMSIDYYYRARIEQARNIKSILGIGARLVLPATILVAVAVSIAGFAVVLVKWWQTNSGYPSRNYGR